MNQTTVLTRLSRRAVPRMNYEILEKKRQMKILIIDGAEEMRSFLSEVVQAMGFTLIEAADGREGLAVLAKEMQVAMILLDINLPDMSGVDFLREARRNELYTGIKMLMVPIHSSMDSVKPSLQSGAQDYLMKPVTKKMLEDKFHFLGLH